MRAFVVDASGPRGFLHRILPLEESRLRWLPPTVGLYSHFEQVERWDRLHDAIDEPPYAPDDAALHHVFPGGWIWMLRFNNGIVSAGAALTDEAGQRLRASEGAPAWSRLLDELPAVRAQFDRARPTMPFVYSPRLAFRTERVAGSEWALLPSAAGVIDPLLSTGFPMTLLGVSRLLEILGNTKAGVEREMRLREYEAITLAELDATEQIVAALYAAMNDVELFKRLSLLYFAAASYSEAARRLGKAQLAPGFLLHAHPRFGPRFRSLVERGIAVPKGAARARLLADIDTAIEPFDTAGLLDRSRRDWYRVLADDLISSAPKLDATVVEIEALLVRSGFAEQPRT
jgi:tetracycline 7-halogenase / FADH2 O2-dependent halogenase